MPFPSSHTILYKLFHYTFLKAKLKPNDWPVIYLQTTNDKKNIIACCYLNENDEIEIQMIDTNKGIEKKEKCIKDGSELKEDDREVSFDVKENEREEKLNELVNDLEIEGVHKENEKHEEEISQANEESERVHKEAAESNNEDEFEDLHKEDVEAEKAEAAHEQSNDSINAEVESMHKENNESINNTNSEDKANINKDSTKDSLNDRAMKKDSIQNNINTRNAVNNNTVNITKQSLYKQKKAILFLHDRNQTRYDNTEFISSLKSLNYTILIPDISGFADTKSKFSFPRSINDIQRCLDFLSSFDVTIIGSGFGAFLVINYASTFYDYKTVLINPTSFTHYYSSLFESHSVNLEHFVSEKTIVFCVGQEESMKIGGKIGCKIYRSESDSVKSLMCNEEVVRKVDEFMQEE